VGGRCAALSKRARPRRRRCRLSSLEAGPLLKRLVCHRVLLRHRRRWTMKKARGQLEALYGRGGTYRSVGQRTLTEHILASDGEIVVMPRIDEGKSLTFPLPPRLRGASTTVVVAPLMVLRRVKGAVRGMGRDGGER
jgi:superfamily II DNA helicase RecQ